MSSSVRIGTDKSGAECLPRVGIYRNVTNTAWVSPFPPNGRRTACVALSALSVALGALVAPQSASAASTPSDGRAHRNCLPAPRRQRLGDRATPTTAITRPRAEQVCLAVNGTCVQAAARRPAQPRLRPVPAHRRRAPLPGQARLSDPGVSASRCAPPPGCWTQSTPTRPVIGPCGSPSGTSARATPRAARRRAPASTARATRCTSTTGPTSRPCRTTPRPSATCRYMHRITAQPGSSRRSRLLSQRRLAYHVAIYAGHGYQYAAATPRDGVRYQAIWSRDVVFGTDWH